jgi:streptothricin acetyltransferase
MDAPARYVEIREDPLEDLSHYLEIRSRFESRTFLDVHQGIEGFSLSERDVPVVYRKDYDAVEDPRRWLKEFDVSCWGMLSAFRGKKRVGGAIAALRSPGVEFLEGRDDLVVLWDIRVALAASRTGVGSALVSRVEEWARIRHCCELKVETQNTNVAACRFYQSQGFQLSEANRDAYPGRPEDVQLIWRKRVAA